MRLQTLYEVANIQGLQSAPFFGGVGVGGRLCPDSTDGVFEM